MKKRVIYIAPWQTSFVSKDLSLLNKNYEVICPDHNWKKAAYLPLTFLIQLIFLLKHVRKSHAIIVMFGGYWSFLPSLVAKVFGKRCFILLGGMDCVSFPALNYGSLRKPLQRWFIKYSYKWSTRLLPVDESLAYSINSYAKLGDEIPQGYRHHFPFIKTPYTVIPNGFETIQIQVTERTPNSFVTLAAADSHMRYHLKGLDTVVELARKLPTCRFTIIGCEPSLVPDNLPDNLHVFGFLVKSEFEQHLIQSEYYLQLSLSEGFPNALGEGMMHGCIPIVSNVGAMPMMIGNSGFVMKENSSEQIAEALNEIMTLPDDQRAQLSKNAITRIKTEFPLERRERELLEVIE